MWNWLSQNAEWIFSGIGCILLLAIIRWLIRMFQRRRSNHRDQSPQSIATLELTSKHNSPSKCEFLPLTFEIRLNQEIPKIVASMLLALSTTLWFAETSGGRSKSTSPAAGLAGFSVPVIFSVSCLT